jgi:Flp pilus assembly protein TadG
MVEFAVVAALIFFPIVFGIIEFGRLVWARNMVGAAAREGVRYAIVHGSESAAIADSAAVAIYVEGRTGLAPIAVSTAWTDPSKAAGETVTVTVKYTYSPVVKIPGLLTSKTVTGSSKQIIAY